MTSVFMNKTIEPIVEKFNTDCEFSVKDAIDGLYNSLGIERMEFEKNSGNIIESLEKYGDGVSHADAVFAIQTIGDILCDAYNNMSSEEKDAMLETVRDTDIPVEIKGDLCKTIMRDAIAEENLERLRFAYAEADGISPEMLQPLRSSIEVHFGADEMKRADAIVNMKENPELTMNEMNQKLRKGEITISEYIDFASYASQLPSHYQETSGIKVELEEDEKQLAFNINTEKILNGENIVIPISDNKEEMTIGKSDAIELIQKHQMKNGSILDSVSEVNLPPTNPNFASELAQKADIYASTQYSAAISDEDKRTLAYILTDEQKSIFDNKLDDISKEQKDEILEHFNDGDRDFDGISDVIPVDEYDELEEKEEEVSEEQEEEEENMDLS